MVHDGPDKGDDNRGGASATISNDENRRLASRVAAGANFLFAPTSGHPSAVLGRQLGASSGHWPNVSSQFLSQTPARTKKPGLEQGRANVCREDRRAHPSPDPINICRAPGRAAPS